MTIEKKRSSTAAHGVRNARSTKSQVSYGLIKQHVAAAQREVVPSRRPLPSVMSGRRLAKEDIGLLTVTDEEIRKLVATARVDRLLVMLRERIVKENGRHILEFLTLKGEQAKPRIENDSGLSLSTEEAGKVIGRSSEAVRVYIKKNLLAGYTAANDQTKIRLPAWQFDGSEVYEWVPRLIEAFGENGWPLLNFVTVAREPLGKSYLDLLKAGEVDQVVAAAKRANPD